jgi:hypothetical protein
MFNRQCLIVNDNWRVLVNVWKIAKEHSKNERRFKLIWFIENKKNIKKNPIQDKK